jgi:hypothetical protein
MSELKKLKNIGARTVKSLNEIGIFSVEEFFATDEIELYKKLRAKNPNKDICICALWQIVGAKLDLPWFELPEEIKEKFLREIG